MTLKNLFSRLYRKEAKRNFWLTGISAFLIFLVLPFYFLQQIIAYDAMFETMSGRDVYIFYEITYNNGFLALVLGGLAMLNGIFLFEYLFSRSKQDFFFSQPVKRSTWFWCCYVQGIINVLIPYLISLFLLIILAVVEKCYSGVFIAILFQNFAVYFLSYLTVYTITVCAVILTGKLLFAVLGTAVIIFYFPAWYMLSELIFEGCSWELNTVFSRLCLVSPVSTFYSLSVRAGRKMYANETDVLKYIPYDWRLILLMGIMLLLFLVLARYLYGKRAVESAGRPVVFSKAKAVIKTVLSMYFSIGTAYLFSEFFISSSMLCKILGLLIGIILGLYILDAVMELNWKAFLHNWKRHIPYVVICMAAFIAVTVYANTKRYHGFEDIKWGYDVELAVKDGCVILAYDQMTDGESAWDTFYEKTKNKEEGKIRLVQTEYEEMEYIDLVYEDGTFNVYNSAYANYRWDKYFFVKELTGKQEGSSEEETLVVLTQDKDMTYDDWVRSFNWEMDEERYPGQFQVLFRK